MIKPSEAADVCRLFGWCCGCGSDLPQCPCLCATCGRRLNDHVPMPDASQRIDVGTEVHAQQCLTALKLEDQQL